MGLLGGWLSAGPLVLIGGIHSWRRAILLVVVTLDGRKVMSRERNADGWRWSLHGRGS